MINYLFSNPLTFAVYVLALLVAITIHEYSHARTADRLGDPTPGLQGRISLNPIRHLDLMGTLFLFLFGFGWGKPVEFDPFNLKNPRKDAGLISIAGPASNLILALLLSVVLRLFIFLGQTEFIAIGMFIFTPIIAINIMLGVFNLIPIHPLDGFKIVGAVLSREKASEWYQLQRYGILFLLLLIIPVGGSSMLSGFLMPAMNFILGFLIPGGII